LKREIKSYQNIHVIMKIKNNHGSDKLGWLDFFLFAIFYDGRWVLCK